MTAIPLRECAAGSQRIKSKFELVRLTYVQDPGVGSGVEHIATLGL